MDLNNRLLQVTIVSTFVFFILLWIYGRFGPGIPLSINSVQTTKTTLFTVSGTGKASATPNMAIINLGIQVESPTVAQAQSQANSTMNKITADLKSLGLADKDLTTSNYSVYPQYDPQTGRSITGYNVSINLTVKVHDLDKVNGAIDKATADGANSIGGLQFTLDDTLQKRLENEARVKAIAQAKQKAQDLASLTGITLGRIVDIQENHNSPRPIPLTMEAAKGLGGGTPTQVQPGSAEVDLSVSLSYEIR